MRVPKVLKILTLGLANHFIGLDYSNIFREIYKPRAPANDGPSYGGKDAQSAKNLKALDDCTKITSNNFRIIKKLTLRF